jgi:DNA-binding SARP family transcriptional activator
VDSRLSRHMCVRLLAEFSLTCDGSPAGLHSRRLQALLAYLILHQDAPQSRQRIAFTFWPDSDESQAMTNLRQAVHTLRRTLPDCDQYLAVTTRTLQWCGGASIQVDVLDFERAVELAAKAGQHGDRAVSLLEKALDTYQGDLLPGLYDEWVLAERERLRQLYSESLRRIIKHLEMQRDYQSAIRYARQLLRHDPLAEATYRDLMRLHLLNHDRASASRVYQECESVLESEMGVEPGTATRDLHRQVLHLEDLSAAGEPGPALPDGAPPLVGRDSEWAQLQAIWHGCERGQAHFVAISGEAGIGKTRLAEELLVWASRQGIATSRTRSYAAEGRLAYAPVADWLRSSTLRPAVSRLDAVWRTEVARLLPEILAEAPDLPAPGPLADSWQRQHLFAALAHATVGAVQPLLLLIDDLQWCDQDTLEWLHYLLRFDPSARLLVAGTVRSDEIEPEHPLHTLLRELLREERLTEITLGPLEPAATAELAGHVAGRALDAATREWLYRQTEGHPLFVVETTRVNSARDTLRPVDSSVPEATGGSLPPRARAIITARLAQLSPPAYELAGLAATIGRAFSLDALVEASERDEDTVVQALDELWQRHIVREHGDAYDFSHDKFREEAYSELSPVKRRMLHRRVAQTLERTHVNNLDPISGQLAAHFERAGMLEQAVLYYQRASDVARRVYASAEAITLLSRGLAALARLPQSTARDEQELALQTALGIAFFVTQGAGSHETNAAYRRVHILSTALGIPIAHSVLRSMAIGHVLVGEHDQAVMLGQQLLDSAEQDSDNPAPRMEAHYVLGVAHFWLGNFVESRRNLEQSISFQDLQWNDTHTVEYGHDPRVICLIRMALTLLYLGYHDQARSHCQQALILAHEHSHPYSLMYALVFASWVAREQGDVLSTEEYVNEALVIPGNAAMGSFWLPGQRCLSAWIDVVRGEVDSGMAAVRSAIADHDAQGQQMHLLYLLTVTADACRIAGLPDEGLAVVSKAFSLLERTNERFSEAEFHRLHGELLLLAGGDEKGAEMSFRRALDVASRQQARHLELRAALSLGRLWKQQGKASESVALIKPVYDWFSTEIETADLRDARTLLTALT